MAAIANEPFVLLSLITGKQGFSKKLDMLFPRLWKSFVFYRAMKIFDRMPLPAMKLYLPKRRLQE